MKSLKRGLKIDGQLMQIIFITRRSFYLHYMQSGGLWCKPLSLLWSLGVGSETELPATIIDAPFG